MLPTDLNDNVYIGGRNEHRSAVVAKWNGKDLRIIDLPVVFSQSLGVVPLVDNNNDLYLGVNKNKDESCLLKMKGSTWSVLNPEKPFNGAVHALAVDKDNNIFIGGDFFCEDGSGKKLRYVAKWGGDDAGFKKINDKP